MMKHEAIQKLLPELAAGTLDDERRSEFEQHVSACGECREWLETYQLLETALTATHPQAEELVRHALDHDPNDEITEHLKSCSDCRRDAELSRSAVSSSRPEGQEDDGPPSWPAFVTVPRLALAAAILIAVVAIPALFFQIGEPERLGSHDLLGTSLSGRELIAADRSITAAQTAILPGAEVTFLAGDVVAFGDGFSVNKDASLAIEIRK